MDIDLLSKMVKELILDNDKVVLPGLGCFVAEMVPASFSDKGYTINPPYRRLYFRARPDEGDALVSFYAKTNDLEYPVAERIIKDFLAELKSVLHVRKAVAFPGLGRMRATKENNLFFIADEDLDIFPSGFGLESISLKTHNETKEEVRTAVAGLKSIIADSEPVAPVAEPEVLPADDSEVTPVAEPEVLPADDSEVVPVSDKDVCRTERKGGRIILKTFLILLLTVVVLLIVYVLLGRLCPELVDRLLYTPAELEIINYR